VRREKEGGFGEREGEKIKELSTIKTTLRKKVEAI